MSDKPPLVIKDSLTLQTFKESNVPKEIDGCICLSYLSESDKKNKQCLLVKGVDGSAINEIVFVSIKDRLERFRLVSDRAGVEKYVDENGIYTLEISELSRKEIGYEYFQIKGKVRLFSSSHSVTYFFIGFCGC